MKSKKLVKIVASEEFKLKLILFLILGIGSILRFHKLDWGQGYYFHPDEYHIAIAVSKIRFPFNLHPELFSYGSLTVYLIYFLKSLFALNSSTFLVGRFVSASFSSLSLVVFYLLTKEFVRKELALISTFLIAISPGIIQQAHFATPESALTFFMALSVLLWIKFIKHKRLKYYFLSAISMGFAGGVKITAAVYLPILFIVPFINLPLKKKLVYKALSSLIAVLLVAATFFLVFPYSILDFSAFRSSYIYETSVATGSLSVFYTRQFVNTLPLIFQAVHIYPVTLNILIFLFGTLGFITTLTLLVRRTKKSRASKISYFILLFAFVLYTLPNLALYAKWTRFLSPTFAYFPLFAVIFFEKILSNSKASLKILNIFTTIALIVLITYSTLTMLMFFSIYQKDDVRISATNWVNAYITEGSTILTEQGNILEVPLKGNYNKIAFDFYNLERQPVLQSKLPDLLESSDYFIVQSRRMFSNHIRLADQFPITSGFYTKLFSGELGFTQIAEFSSYPQLDLGFWKIQNNDELSEETWTVFDHPVVRVFSKSNKLSKSDYEKILYK
jgi:hypothetical protein